jgi:DNA-binding response OmpR family regulator
VTGLVQQQKRILIVDDEQDIAMILQINLEDKGFKADSYTDPVAAYENF